VPSNGGRGGPRADERDAIDADTRPSNVARHRMNLLRRSGL